MGEFFSEITRKRLNLLFLISTKRLDQILLSCVRRLLVFPRLCNNTQTKKQLFFGNNLCAESFLCTKELRSKQINGV